MVRGRRKRRQEQSAAFEDVGLYPLARYQRPNLFLMPRAEVAEGRECVVLRSRRRCQVRVIACYPVLLAREQQCMNGGEQEVRGRLSGQRVACECEHLVVVNEMPTDRCVQKRAGRGEIHLRVAAEDWAKLIE